MSAIVHSAAQARWRPAPIILASAALHVAALATVVLFPDAWAWALAAVAANHVALTAIGLWPRSHWLGPNFTRLPAAAAARGEIALTFDDGPDPALTPRVLEVLEAHGVRATFFCVAAQAARHPELAREIVRRGHSVENHSNVHANTFAFLLLRGLRRDFAASQSTLAALTGRAPRFFRPPMGFRNPLLDPVLHETGLRLVSWTRRGYDTRRGDANRVAADLERGLAAGDILMLHDGHAALTGAGEPVVLEVLPRLVAAIRQKGLKPVTLHQAIDP
jgi:peptidoglycan/xylan/chitin deacetylase (PgdA/CDA1 family)